MNQLCLGLGLGLGLAGLTLNYMHNKVSSIGRLFLPWAQLSSFVVPPNKSPLVLVCSKLKARLNSRKGASWASLSSSLGEAEAEAEAGQSWSQHDIILSRPGSVAVAVAVTAVVWGSVESRAEPSRAEKRISAPVDWLKRSLDYATELAKLSWHKRRKGRNGNGWWGAQASQAPSAARATSLLSLAGPEAEPARVRVEVGAGVGVGAELACRACHLARRATRRRPPPVLRAH